MTRVFKPRSARQEAAFLDQFCHGCTREMEGRCPILQRARRLEADDAAYPDEWRLDDMGEPVCTAFAPSEVAVQPEPVAAHATPAEPPPVEIVSIAATEIARGLVADIKLRKGRRAWTVPYAQVHELFEPGQGVALRDALGVPTPTSARVHRGRQHLTITAKSRRDMTSVSSSVRVTVGGRR